MSYRQRRLPSMENRHRRRPLDLLRMWHVRIEAFMLEQAGIARAVYAAVQGRTLLVLHAFVKKTQTTPRAAIETAAKRLKEAP